MFYCTFYFACDRCCRAGLQFLDCLEERLTYLCSHIVTAWQRNATKVIMKEMMKKSDIDPSCLDHKPVATPRYRTQELFVYHLSALVHQRDGSVV